MQAQFKSQEFKNGFHGLKVEFELWIINCKVEFEFFRSQTQQNTKYWWNLCFWWGGLPCLEQFDVSVEIPSISQSWYQGKKTTFTCKHQ